MNERGRIKNINKLAPALKPGARFFFEDDRETIYHVLELFPEHFTAHVPPFELLHTFPIEKLLEFNMVFLPEEKSSIPNQLFFEIDNRHFAVNLRPRSYRLMEGEVFNIIRFINKDGFAYCSRSDSTRFYDALNDDCALQFEFSFCWRGVWEGRIYFPNDSEFWAEDLKAFADLWSLICNKLKEIIRASDPNERFDD